MFNMWFYLYILLVNTFLFSYGAQIKDAAYKDQYCTDPRTMNRHAAYTEWADAYSCTRHRCQPGGRNLAIYTVGCKRVEAPESAIECEEVVEDTNMMFPYCCTRLRCLVVVRGEVWTRVLGQPWETLPAAPWSHMYKMKKPPPGEFENKQATSGPVYELAETEPPASPAHKHGKGGKRRLDPAYDDPTPRASQDPVIGTAEQNNEKNHEAKDRHTARSVSQEPVQLIDDLELSDKKTARRHESPEEFTNEKVPETSEEKFYAQQAGVRKAKTRKAHDTAEWTEATPTMWENEPKPVQDNYVNRDQHSTETKKEEKPQNLQALVDAIGNRMRDIESVVQKMSEKVQQGKETDDVDNKGEPFKEMEDVKQIKKENPNTDYQSRFATQTAGVRSKYLHNPESVTDQPLYVEDSGNGYFSDAVNSVIRRSGIPKEPLQPDIATYMAPVESHKKAHVAETPDEEPDRKHKKRHRKRKSKSSRHKKHKKSDKKRRFSKVNSIEVDKNNVSYDDDEGIIK